MGKNVYKPAASKYYYLRVSIDGKKYRESLKTTSEKAAERLARKRINELKAAAETGKNDWLFQNGYADFYDSLDSPVEDHGWSESTRERYQTSLRQIGQGLIDIFEDRGVEIEDVMAWEITTAEVSEYVSRRKEGGASIATVNRDHTAFGHPMTSIKNDGWIDENPVRSFEKTGMQENLPDIVMPSDSSIRKLADRAPGTLVHFPGFLDATGGRTTEISMLKWSDIDLPLF